MSTAFALRPGSVAMVEDYGDRIFKLTLGNIVALWDPGALPPAGLSPNFHRHIYATPMANHTCFGSPSPLLLDKTKHACGTRSHSSFSHLSSPWCLTMSMRCSMALVSLVPHLEIASMSLAERAVRVMSHYPQLASLDLTSHKATSQRPSCP